MNSPSHAFTGEGKEVFRLRQFRNQLSLAGRIPKSFPGDNHRPLPAMSPCQQMDVCTGHSDCSAPTIHAQPGAALETKLQPEKYLEAIRLRCRVPVESAPWPFAVDRHPKTTRGFPGSANRRIARRQAFFSVCQEWVQQPCHRFTEARVATFADGWRLPVAVLMPLQQLPLRPLPRTVTAGSGSTHRTPCQSITHLRPC